MAPQPTYYRLYCKECGTYRLHNFIDEEKNLYECRYCNHIHVPEKLSIIPQEEQIAQRRRYKEANFNDIMSLFAQPRYSIFGPEFWEESDSNAIIIESDAGQKEIDRINREEARKEYEEYKAAKEEYDVFYKHLNRNDKCACGSGKKYKNCCINKFKNI